jgi:hypothetical protein
VDLFSRRPERALLDRPRSRSLHDINGRIREFVERPENRRLKSGTGAFSTPFRGRLFGLERIIDVDEQLRHEQVDALWLGSNPNVPESVRNILANGTDSCFASFDEQMTGGLLSQPGWDPIEAPPHPGWETYRDALDGPLRRPRVLMANVIPWGSSVTAEFLQPLAERDAGLARRLLVFADELHGQVLDLLRPRLVLVPRSLAEDRTIWEQCPEFSLLAVNLPGRRDGRVPETGRALRYYSGRLQRAERRIPALFLPHPSALRLNKERRGQVVSGLRAEIARLLEEAC